MTVETRAPALGFLRRMPRPFNILVAVVCAGIAALKVDTTPARLSVSWARRETEIINSLSVMQARALYDSLKKIFGG
jgi:hypothetical protein